MIETLQKTASKAVNSMAQSHQMAETSVMDAESASASLEQISQAITQISDMASQIATAAEEQTSVTSEINRNTESIREVSQTLSQEPTAPLSKRRSWRSCQIRCAVKSAVLNSSAMPKEGANKSHVCLHRLTGL